MLIYDLLQHNGVDVREMEQVVIASVVPDIMYSLNTELENISILTH